MFFLYLIVTEYFIYFNKIFFTTFFHFWLNTSLRGDFDNFFNSILIVDFWLGIKLRSEKKIQIDRLLLFMVMCRSCFTSTPQILSSTLYLHSPPYGSVVGDTPSHSFVLKQQAQTQVYQKICSLSSRRARGWCCALCWCEGEGATRICSFKIFCFLRAVLNLGAKSTPSPRQLRPCIKSCRAARWPTLTFGGCSRGRRRYLQLSRKSQRF